MEGYSESTETIDAVNILPLARFEPTTWATPPSTTPDADATSCATETSPKKDVQEALILTTTDAVHVVYIYTISLSQKTSHWLAKIAQRHAPAFGERSHSVQYVALGFHPS